MHTLPLKCGIVCLVMLMYNVQCNSAGESSTSLPVLLTEAYCKDSNADRNTEGLGKNLPTHHKKIKHSTLCRIQL